MGLIRRRRYLPWNEDLKREMLWINLTQSNHRNVKHALIWNYRYSGI